MATGRNNFASGSFNAGTMAPKKYNRVTTEYGTIPGLVQHRCYYVADGDAKFLVRIETELDSEGRDIRSEMFNTENP